MAKIFGVVKDFNDNILRNADVYVKDRDGNNIYEAKTNENGYYEIEIKEKNNFSIFIVKDYAVNYLEYLGTNISIIKDIELNAKIGGLEIYGLNCFRIKGAYPSLSIYFRPMSLLRYKNLDENTRSDLEKDNIKITINDENVKILYVNKVKEYLPEDNLDGYLVQVSLPNNTKYEDYNKIEVEVYDKETKEKGMALTFWKDL